MEIEVNEPSDRGGWVVRKDGLFLGSTPGGDTDDLASASRYATRAGALVAAERRGGVVKPVSDYQPKPASPTEAIERLENELKSLRQTFDLRWKADMRAVKRWRAATGRELAFPDHADLVIHLLNELERLEDEIAAKTTKNVS